MSEADAAGGIPPVHLYKYRALDRPTLGRLGDIVLRNNLWFASPLTFNDPFDCFPAIDTSGNLIEKRAWAKRYADRHHIGRNRADRRAFVADVANRQLKRGLGSTLSDDGGRDAWRQTVAKMGVLSLTPHPDDMLMWGHYAESHTGVCLEFATSALPLSLAHRVRYTSERPVFRPLDRDRSDLMERTLLRKADVWAYEDEWRVFGQGQAGNIAFPADALTGIILGASIRPDDEIAIKAMTEQRSSPIPIRRAEIDGRHYRLRVVPT